MVVNKVFTLSKEDKEILIDLEELIDKKIKESHTPGGISHIHYGIYISPDIKDILVHRYHDADWVLTFIRPHDSEICHILIR